MPASSSQEFGSHGPPASRVLSFASSRRRISQTSCSLRLLGVGRSSVRSAGYRPKRRSRRRGVIADSPLPPAALRALPGADDGGVPGHRPVRIGRDEAAHGRDAGRDGHREPATPPARDPALARPGLPRRGASARLALRAGVLGAHPGPHPLGHARTRAGARAHPRAPPPPAHGGSVDERRVPLRLTQALPHAARPRKEPHARGVPRRAGPRLRARGGD